VDEHELHAQRRKEIQVVSEIEEATIGHDVAAERNDENLSAERVDIRRDGLEPVDESILARQALAPCGWRARAFGFPVRAVVA
jgi:hypothetical protein